MNARAIAAMILDKVEHGYKPQESIDQIFKNQIIIEKDKSLITDSIYQVLRLRGNIDYIINTFCSKNKVEKSIINILRVATYQILYLDRVPDWAVISEVQKAIKDVKKRKFVRAILAKISNCTDFELPYKDRNNRIKYISINYSHPIWLVERWRKRFGDEETIKLCLMNNSKGKHTLLVNKLETDRETLTKRLKENGYEVENSIFASYGLYINKISGLMELEEYQNGFFDIQSESSQIVPQVISPKRGERILDLCAGRGGKTINIAMMMDNVGEIIAIDIDKNKIETLKANIKRLKIGIVKAIAMDSLDYLDGEGFDKILLDAPCSGLGSLRQHPDIKWKISKKNISNLATLQLKLLESAYKNIKSGGEILYVTCSFEEEETTSVIENFLENKSDIKIISATSQLDEALRKLVSYKEFFLSIPGKIGLDGFFMARMRKD